MIEAPTPLFLERGKRGPAPRRAGAGAPIAWGSASGQPIEIVVHDRDSARILLEHAVPLFAAEMVAGPVWAVRLQPPAGEGWIMRLLTLVEGWLETARLPCAKVLYGGRSYLIRTSPDGARSSTVTDITRPPRLVGGGA